jgi:hypothetical protein
MQVMNSAMRTRPSAPARGRGAVHAKVPAAVDRSLR